MAICIIHYIHPLPLVSHCFFFNDTATTEIYTLSLHDALPIFHPSPGVCTLSLHRSLVSFASPGEDRKSTRLNSSHQIISYAVFCLKKKIMAIERRELRTHARHRRQACVRVRQLMRVRPASADEAVAVAPAAHKRPVHFFF